MPLFLRKGHTYSFHKVRREQELIKPVGLWISVDGEDDWLNWCKRENWGLERLSRRYRIFLRPDHNIRILTDVSSILDFSKEFAVEPPSTTLLYWDRIKRLYQGLIISPFQFNLHICCDCSWYYGWDCESGCIWDVDAIERYEEDLSWNH
jgi:hypothetical protein